jgi:hypothetical protein
MNKKLTILLVILLILVLIPSFYLYMFFIGGPKTDGDFTTIKMERSACFGSCPVYTIEIKSNGEITYNGERYVETKGKQKLQLSKSEINALKDAISESRFYSLNDRYDGNITDLPATTITLKTITGEKSVYDYYMAPPRLSELEKKIDKIAGIEEFIKCDDTCTSEWDSINK